MTVKGWLVRLAISIAVLGVAAYFVFFNEAVLLGHDTDIAFLIIRAMLVIWSLRNLFTWRCSKRGSFFALDVAGTRTLKAGWEREENILYRCRECGHKQKSIRTTSPVDDGMDAADIY